MRTLTKQELNQVLHDHLLSIENKGGNRADLHDANLSRANLSGANLIAADLVGADLSDANLIDANLIRANLSGANLSGTNLIDANLICADLSGADLSGADLRDANLGVADLCGANLYGADLRGANLIDANLSGADLSGADLSGVNLAGTIGIGTKEAEMAFAKNLLSIFEQNEGDLNMAGWHTCDTVHCIAGWYAQGEKDPSAIASRALPTLTKYFFASNEEALGALKRVASGEESVWN